jgi:6-pyruvoyltetrahydropterin/6-carboxytetrahydropterin synthase
MVYAIRFHDISCGHRVVGHENKCRLLHGHNYRIHFHIDGEKLDEVGRVIDFGVIKSILCEWLEENLDHKTLIWTEDPMLPALKEISAESIHEVPFNPTAENIAKYLVDVIGPRELAETETRLVKVIIEETRKCSVAYEIA